MSTDTSERPHAGLQRLLEADDEQAALDAAVAMLAHLFDGTAVGVLRSRAEYISSASVDNDSPLRSLLFLEAVQQLKGAPAHDAPYIVAGSVAPITCIPVRIGERLVGLIAVASAITPTSVNGQLDTVHLALTWAIERIRRAAETQLLYDISLRLSGKSNNGQLLGEVLVLINETFKARASRVFLVDRRVNDLVMIMSSAVLSEQEQTERLYHSMPSSATVREIMPNRPDEYLQFLRHDGDIHLLETLRIPRQGSVAGMVVEHGESVLLNRARPDDIPHVALESGLMLSKLVCVPLSQAHHVVGALMLINRGDDPDFTAEDERLLSAIGGIIAIMLANARLYQRAIRDALTGAYNRGAFETRLHEQWERWFASREGFALLILDLDDFKQINDRFGHVTGDAVLRAVTQLLWEALRDEDTIFRYGGEEFCVILDRIVDVEQALRVADRLRSALDCDIRIGGLVSISISASIGVAIHPLHGAQTPHMLISMADDAAYAAKRRGKNRVVLADGASE